MTSASSFSTLLRKVSLPELLSISQPCLDDSLPDVAAEVAQAWERSGLAARLPSGGSVALAVGSRGIAALRQSVVTTVHWLKAHGVKPFIVPAMGSHGGATAEGQLGILAALDITETSVGCPIRASMDVVELGRLPGCPPVFMDKHAAEADGVIVINRVKPHTAFSGTHESGLVKMLTIGLGKQRGAEACHALGYEFFGDIMPAMARVMLARGKIIGGLGLVENALDKTCLVRVVPAEYFLEEDAALLATARERIPRLPTDALDVLIIQRMGKEISGTGMDPNVTGRSPSPCKQVPVRVQRMGVLSLTPASHGNATGVGCADVITAQLHASINMTATYANVLTSTMLRSAFMPVVMPTDELAVRCMIHTCNARHPEKLRLAYIRDTLTLHQLWVSAPVAEEAAKQGAVVNATPQPFVFAPDGRLLAPAWEA